MAKKVIKAPNIAGGRTTSIVPAARGLAHPGVSQDRSPTGVIAPGAVRRDFSKPIQDSLYNEIAQNTVRDAIASLDLGGNWFSPLQPVQPFGPPKVNYPRTFDYRTGINLDIRPGKLDMFTMLRGMSRSWGLLRTVIETRKDQFMRMPHAFQIKGKPRAKDPRLQELNQFFRRPDGKNTFSRWKRLILEDMLVIDAATVYVWRNKLGQPIALDVLDGATIKPLIDDAGRRPSYPDPAYQQIIKGLPMTNWSERDIRYMPMRPVPDMPIYGYSPVEQILAEITAGIKRLAYQVGFWTEGSMPELMVSVPDSWTPTQLAQYQGMFDALMSGNTNYKSKVRFMPGGMKPFDIKNANGEALKADIDEWWARLICYAYGVSPQPFIRMMNRSTAQSAQQQAEEEGLHPVMLWFKEELMDPLIQEDWGYDDIEFVFLPNPEVDQAKQATILGTYVKEGIMERDEAREQLGLDRIGGPASELVVDTPLGPMALKETVNAAKLKANDQPNDLQRTQEAHDAEIGKTKAETIAAKRPDPKPVVAAPGTAGAKPVAKPGVGKAADPLLEPEEVGDVRRWRRRAWNV